MKRGVTVAVAVLIATMAPASNPGADEHLLAGARFFRNDEFDRALLEFKVAAKLGAGPEATAYVGAALVKLQRPEEAVEAFASVAQTAHDPLLAYYQALACYGARLFLCADEILASVANQAGPRIAEQSRNLRKEISATTAGEPPAGAVDWYLGRGSHACVAGRDSLAKAYFREASGYAQRRKDHHGLEDANAGLERHCAPEAGPERD